MSQGCRWGLVFVTWELVWLHVFFRFSFSSSNTCAVVVLHPQELNRYPQYTRLHSKCRPFLPIECPPCWPSWTRWPEENHLRWSGGQATFGAYFHSRSQSISKDIIPSDFHLIDPWAIADSYLMWTADTCSFTSSVYVSIPAAGNRHNALQNLRCKNGHQQSHRNSNSPWLCVNAASVWRPLSTSPTVLL